MQLPTLFYNLAESCGDKRHWGFVPLGLSLSMGFVIPIGLLLFGII
ncbi:hypothetical protein ACFSSA_14895 [Luteolibacter algae]|uniref:Uncharacterized protein n=1 Tax=Luteolibacter algae TaxID=454151 RepID=A0ABW5DAN4_9BACT